MGLNHVPIAKVGLNERIHLYRFYLTQYSIRKVTYYYRYNCASQVFNFFEVRTFWANKCALGFSFGPIILCLLPRTLPLPSQSPFSTARLKTLQEPSPLDPFRRRFLLDDLGWVPVLPIDQCLDSGGLGRCRVRGSRRPTASRSGEQAPPQLGPGSRPP